MFKGIKMKGKVIAAVAIAFAMVLVVGAGIGSALGAGAIDKSIPLTVEVQTSGNTYQADLDTIPSIPVNFYKVADVDEYGEITSVSKYATQVDPVIAKRNKATTADWQTAAEAIEKIIQADTTVKPDYTAEIKNGVFNPDANNAAQPLKFENADGSQNRGLFLVMVDQSNPIESLNYTYTFSSYLVGVPDNNYRHMSADTTTLSDDWVYDIKVGLKESAEIKVGKIKITKDLKGYHEHQDGKGGLGQTTCVFSIDATRPSVGGGTEVVYSNTVSFTFTEDGNESFEVDGIPVDSTVTVKEIYSGASYENTKSDQLQKTFVLKQGETPEVSFSYENDWNELIVPSYGVQNHFEKNQNGGWDWTTPDVKPGVLQ